MPFSVMNLKSLFLPFTNGIELSVALTLLAICLIVSFPKILKEIRLLVLGLKKEERLLNDRKDSNLVEEKHKKRYKKKGRKK